MLTQTRNPSKELELLAELLDGAKIIGRRERAYTKHEYRVMPGGDAVPTSLMQRLQAQGYIKGRITDNLGDVIEFIVTERGRARAAS